MNPSVLIFTVSFGNPKPNYVDLSERLNGMYAESHGYEFKAFNLPTKFERHTAWARVWYLKENIEKYDYVMYVDGDAFFVNHAMSLLRLIAYMDDSPVCGLFARDQMLENKVFHSDRANAGVFIFSSKNNGKQLADLWWEVPNDGTYTDVLYDSNRYLDHKDTLIHHPYEQLALWFLWDRHPLSFRFVKSYKELNGLDGSFVRHLIKLDDATRASVMAGYYNAKQLKKIN